MRPVASKNPRSIGLVIACIVLAGCTTNESKPEVSGIAGEPYGHWQVNVLNEDGLRACYAETTPVTRRTEEAHRDLALQVTPISMLAGGDYVPVASISDEAFNCDCHADSVLRSWAALTGLFRRGEREDLQVLLKTPDGDTAVRYSLAGFRNAYDALGELSAEPQAMPPASARDVLAHNFEVLATDGDCVEQCAFDITAPFFDREEDTTITLTSQPVGLPFCMVEPEAARRTRDRGGELPLIATKDALIGDTTYFDVTHNGNQLGRVHTPGCTPLGRVTFAACLDPQAGTATLVLKNRSARGKFTVRFDGVAQAMSSEDIFFGFEETGSITNVPDMDCVSGGKQWVWNAPVRPCVCIGIAAVGGSYRKYPDAIAKLVRFVDSISPGKDPRSVAPLEFESPTAQFMRLAPFVYWELAARMDLDSFRPPSYELTAFT